MSAPAVAQHPAGKPSLIQKMAAKYNVDGDKLLATLKNTAFKVRDGEATNEQMMALLVVADQYSLNPFTKEIYAFPDKQNGIVPVVGVDGWLRIINSHPEFDGMEYDEAEGHCTCIIYRKDRSHPVSVTEYLEECRRNTGPWQSHPRRMLRHKATIQCARVAFSFAGIYDPDEAERIAEEKDITPREVAEPPARRTLALESIAGETVEVPAASEPVYSELAEIIKNAQAPEDGEAALNVSGHLPDDQRNELAHLHLTRWGKA